jgi:cation-transporting ATPase E
VTVVLADCTTLPDVPLRPLALISLGDDLRPEAVQVLQALARQGIAVKVLSGDNPETVRATFSRLDLPTARDAVVSGDQLTRASDAAALIESHSVFGRVTPEQKVFIVEALQARGFHVAMTGDGVNDVLAVKRADLGIAMGQGSQATKTVSGLVLENNNFALLPEALEEGRTIVRNLRRSAKLFLVKNVYSLLLILAYASGLFGIPFPYVPQQVTLLNWLVIGMPALVIALSRERSTAATKPRFLREVGWFAVRTGVVFALAGLATLMLAGRIHPDDHPSQRTLFLSVLILLGITALFRALRDGEPTLLVGDRRFRLLGALAIPAYLLAMYVPVSYRFFELVPLSLPDWLWVLLIAAVAYGVSLLTDRLTLACISKEQRLNLREDR